MPKNPVPKNSLPRNPLPKQTRFNVGFAVAAFVGLFLIQYVMSVATQVATIPYSQFQQLLKDGKVAEVGISDRFIQGKLKEPLENGKSHSSSPPGSIRNSPSELQKYNVRFTGQIESDVPARPPVLDHAGRAVLRRVDVAWPAHGQGLGGGLMSIGKSKAKIYVETDTGVTFEDVAGVDEAKDELPRSSTSSRTRSATARLGGRMPKGVLLVGPPGTGKTLLAKAVAGEAKVPFFSISGSEFVEMFVGVGAARVRDLFEQAREKAPAIIFIDELDALGRARGIGPYGGRPRREGADAQPAARRDGRLRHPHRASSSSRPPTGRKSSIRRCCGPAASTVRCSSTGPTRRAASRSFRCT